MKVKVRVHALNDSIFEGKISRIGQVADVYARAFRLSYPANNEFMLKPGMIAIISIPTGKKS